MSLLTTVTGGTLTPQARGWTHLARLRNQRPDAYPAGAGMDRATSSMVASTAGLPRRRGDGPLSMRSRDGLAWLTPQARGWTRLQGIPLWNAMAYPAGAGMDLDGGSARSGRDSLPRRRGDGPVPGLLTHRGGWLTPQARGWTHSVAGDA